jgi:hypothetical protein
MAEMRGWTSSRGGIGEASDAFSGGKKSACGFPQRQDRQEIFPPEVTGTHKEIFAWAVLTPEVTGTHKEFFAWENVAPEIRE